MPTIVTHAVAAVAAGQWFRPGLPSSGRNPGGSVRTIGGDGRLPPGFWLLTACCAMLPDADVVAFTLGIPYDHLLGHRGLSHSFAAAAAVGAVCAWGVRAAGSRIAYGRLLVFFTLATASHGLLDGLTDGGRGVALFAPLSPDRLFFPWRPIRVSPVGTGFLTARDADGALRAWGVIRSELLWIWTPALAAGWLGRWWRRRRDDPR